jgi:tetratricopeptide (TPR) repeat protein
MNHSTAVFLRIEAIFNEALEAPAESRPALIAAQCDGDPLLISEVESLLRASEAEEHLTASHRTEPGAEREALPDRRRIGPYELDRLLGRGGMGAVYLAHRADGQFEQQVAIKLIDLPLATDFFRERFRMERQILAGLQHPFIARLLDGGVSADGDLYLAMEYVDGTPISRFCDTRRLNIRQRLTLFKGVCEAVQFAHQNLVVHRDLKPDNILVAEDGTPRLLDFGTAKLVSPSLEKQEGDLTRQGYASFTPQYASPEQVLGNPITTASDTYSLGVLLYLLLTGSHPYELKELTTSELLRVICKEPPRKPPGEVGTDRRLDPDLEAILLKALRKEPTERYRTAEQLASDIQDFLDGRPVAARRGSFRYIAGKFIRRNRLAIAAAAVLAATLAAGVLGVLWQARVANEQRRKAEARSADLRQLSNSLLSELDEAIKDLPGSTGVQKLLVTRVLEHLDRMGKDSEGDRQTHLDLIGAYTRLGEVQGNVYEQNLGDPLGALASIGKAIALAEPLVQANPQDREALRALATAQEDRGEVLSGLGNPQDSVAALTASVQTYDRLIALPGVTPELILEESTVNQTLGDEVGQDTGLADIPGAIAAYRKSLDLDRQALRLDPNFLPARRGLANMELHVGNAELDIDPVQALKEFRIAFQLSEQLPQSEKGKLDNVRTRAILVRKEAVALSELGQYSQAAPLFQQALKVFQSITAADTANTKDVRALGDLKRLLNDMATSYEDAADPLLAEAPSDRRRNLLTALQLWQQEADSVEQILKHDRAHEDSNTDLASAQVHIGAIQQTLHESGNAEEVSRTALVVLKQFAMKDQASSRDIELAVSAILIAQPTSLRDPQLAVAWAERGVILSHRKAPDCLLYLAQAYHAAGQSEKASEVAKEGLALLPPAQTREPESRIHKLLEIEAQAGSTARN